LEIEEEYENFISSFPVRRDFANS